MFDDPLKTENVSVEVALTVTDPALSFIKTVARPVHPDPEESGTVTTLEPVCSLIVVPRSSSVVAESH